MRTTASDEIEMRTRVDEILNRWPTVGLPVAVVRGGSMAWFHGHGVADIGSGTPVDQDTVFRLLDAVEDFGQTEYPADDDDEFDAAKELRCPEGEAGHAAHAVHADRRD